MIRICGRTAVASVEVGRVTGSLSAISSDELSVEEPLEIRLAGHATGAASTVAVTMRTPGDDVELAAGFLVTEGIIADFGAVASIAHCDANGNVVEARLEPGATGVRLPEARHFFASSSC